MTGARTGDDIRLRKEEKTLREDRRSGEELLQIPMGEQTNIGERLLYLLAARLVHQPPQSEVASYEKVIQEVWPPM